MHNYTPIIDRSINNGTQKVYRFDNQFGASVVSHKYSYGGDRGKWELAVIKFYSDDNDDWSLTYETPITSDVIGHLDEDEVADLLTRVAELPV